MHWSILTAKGRDRRHSADESHVQRAEPKEPAQGKANENERAGGSRMIAKISNVTFRKVHFLLA